MIGDRVNQAPPAAWTRAEEGRLLAGVCAGFARRHDVSPWLVRGIGLVSMVISAGLAIIVYAILALVLPADPPRRKGRS